MRFLIRILFVLPVFFFSCSDRVNGNTSFYEGSMYLEAEFLGYGKNNDEEEDILVSKYESGDLRTFINYSSKTQNTNPYIIKTSTVGADGRSNNCIKITIIFPSVKIGDVLLDILTDAEHVSSFYASFCLDEQEVKKQSLSYSTENYTVSVNDFINKIIVYVESPKTYNNKILNSYFQFNYCLPYTESGDEI